MNVVPPNQLAAFRVHLLVLGVPSNNDIWALVFTLCHYFVSMRGFLGVNKSEIDLGEVNRSMNKFPPLSKCSEKQS